MLHISINGRTRAPFIPDYCFYKLDGNMMVYQPAQFFLNFYKAQKGQIDRDTTFGKELYNLAKTGPSKWLEIGTWNGLGSTKCILDGFAERDDNPRLASIEIDPIMFDTANINLLSHPALQCAKFHQGRLASDAEAGASFPDESLLPNEEKETPHFFINFEREKALYETATLVYPDFAPQVAVLDGGEYSGGLDWIHLDKSELQYLCLDDTNTFKNKKVMSELGHNWSCIASGNDRNGWAIFKRS